MKKFPETDDDRTVVFAAAAVVVVVVVVGVSLFRVVRTDVVDDGAQLQDFPANVRLGFPSSQVGLGPGDRSVPKIKNTIYTRVIYMVFLFFLWPLYNIHTEQPSIYKQCIVLSAIVYGLKYVYDV